ncbi:3-dehydroquinate synthase [Jeotgalibacillus marinus]|uniref:3-dehydroquinate synthase n=1 Tax=Jeotgalibacillus marinus TaxID=86667 RepID=A0ABV3PZU3_9BACL
METVQVKTKDVTYEVVLGEGAIGTLPQVVDALSPSVTSVFYLIDETVYEKFESIIKAFAPKHKRIFWHVLPAGEKVKTFEVYQEVLGAALNAGLDRQSLIIACGGGATGDLAGFVAATYMRGIRFIQLPTTILAHDSAVGGKVAINHPLGKNMVGSFHQPTAVIYDIDFLKTLPACEIRSGFTEVIKHAMIADDSFLVELMQSINTLEEIDPTYLSRCLKRGIEIKASIVEQDERELGIRAYLNFGHTYGHAIEAWAGYGKWSHGEAVMVGIIYALLISKELNNIPFNIHSFINWVKKLGYEVSPPDDASFDELATLMLKDKKTIAQEIRLVILKSIGIPSLQKVTIEQLKEIDHIIRKM